MSMSTNTPAAPGPRALPVVGFIGLGRMGAPLAANLARAGYPLVVWNRGADKAVAFAQAEACDVAADPAELTARADIVVTMVADGDALSAIFLQDPAVLAGLDGGLVLEMSTVGPTFATAFARELAARGVGFVEAPVSGSTAAAAAATLAILVGAGAEDLARVRPLLDVMGNRVVHLGPPGAASLVKLAINNLIYGINQCVSESLVLAERGGLDREAVYDAFLTSAAAAPVMQYRQGAFLHPGRDAVTFTLALAEKDLRLTTELADAVGAPMPQARLNRRLAQEAMAAGFGEEDVAIVAEYLRRAAAAGSLTSSSTTDVQ
jgi:3-hydroxyisobutyrate dehydrogenase-like beta-hydroxyacid dehydrogenase